MKFSPITEHDGLLLKREDLYRYPNGANGSKLRAAERLLADAADLGYQKVITAAACVSPQHALVASAAQKLGMTTTHIVGGTRPETAILHTSVRLAMDAGAEFQYINVGYNPALVAAARTYAQENPDTYWLHYGISAPPEADDDDLRRFHDASASQVGNIPPDVTDVVLPFGSGNTGAGVLWGLAELGTVERVHLMCIGPDRLPWLEKRLQRLTSEDLPEILVNRLHPGFATYGDRMPEKIDGVVMHPTYEGKVVRYLDLTSPKWWVQPEGKTLMWVVGGPLPRLKGSSS
jgi:hypothetical protein